MQIMKITQDFRRTTSFEIKVVRSLVANMYINCVSMHLYAKEMLCDQVVSETSHSMCMYAIIQNECCLPR